MGHDVGAELEDDLGVGSSGIAPTGPWTSLPPT